MSRIFSTSFSAIYPLYLAKVEKKHRTKAELDQVICWLTGFDDAALAGYLSDGTTLAGFFADATTEPQRVAHHRGGVRGARGERR
jgi:hypothetical protein